MPDTNTSTLQTKKSQERIALDGLYIEITYCLRPLSSYSRAAQETLAKAWMAATQKVSQGRTRDPRLVAFRTELFEILVKPLTLSDEEHRQKVTILSKVATGIASQFEQGELAARQQYFLQLAMVMIKISSSR
jgi:hypothetical protein